MKKREYGKKFYERREKWLKARMKEDEKLSEVIKEVDEVFDEDERVRVHAMIADMISYSYPFHNFWQNKWVISCFIS